MGISFVIQNVDLYSKSSDISAYYGYITFLMKHNTTYPDNYLSGYDGIEHFSKTLHDDEDCLWTDFVNNYLIVNNEGLDIDSFKHDIMELMGYVKTEKFKGMLEDNIKSYILGNCNKKLLAEIDGKYVYQHKLPVFLFNLPNIKLGTASGKEIDIWMSYGIPIKPMWSNPKDYPNYLDSID